jgi:hypothetical protein
VEGLFFTIMLLFVAGAAVYYLGFNREAKINRLLHEYPRVSVKGFPDGGTGRITGRLGYAGEPIYAPISGRLCAFYEVTVEEHSNDSWHQILREVHGVDFLLSDESGEALVRMGTAEIAVVKDVHLRSGTWNDANEAMEALLARHHQKSQGMIFNRNLRYKEGVLEAGEPVAVLGRGMREPDPNPKSSAGAYREMATRLVMVSGTEYPLWVSDDPSFAQVPLLQSKNVQGQ